VATFSYHEQPSPKESVQSGTLKHCAEGALVGADVVLVGALVGADVVLVGALVGALVGELVSLTVVPPPQTQHA
jgi:uncharacterized protein YqgC (DUF456 family)